MYSKEYKLEQLKKYYFNHSLKQLQKECPFGKVYQKQSEFSRVSCKELCGIWVELGDVNSGCPCDTLGTLESLWQLRKILIKEGYLDSNGKEF